MLRIIQSSSAASAAIYYTQGLKREDYYTKGQELDGVWHGLALDELGLTAGAVDTAKQFKALLYNKHPITGKKLTLRMNADHNRIPGWDFVFSVPKSCSLLMALTGDESLISAFRVSVRETMAEIEKRIATRVRVDGQQEDRVTGNMAWCEFLHTTTRPLEDGIPDPHYHFHAYVFNLTHDPVEDRIKAAKIREIKENGYYYEALFDSLLTSKLEAIGLPVERTGKGWEIAALNDPLLLKAFSRRTDEVEKLAKELGISDPKLKDQLGATTRNKKQNKWSREELVEKWRARMSPEQLALVEGAIGRKLAPARAHVTASEALAFAEAKCFERNCVVAKNKVIAAALRFGVGSVSTEQVQQEMIRRRFIERMIDGELKVTTPALVVEEALMIQRVREGRGKLAPLLKGRLNFIQDFLSDEQREAVRHILKSNDQVIALRGVAGSGKTTLLTEVRQQLEQVGTRMIALAPSAQASRGVLRDEGFEADTVARFLVDKDLQKKVRGHVLLIDEAGTIGHKDMARLLDIAGSSTRIILSGDTGQHAPVARGDSLRLFEDWAGLPVATVRQIRRQQVEGYRKAVEAMAERDLKTAFAQLDMINAIIEIPDEAARYRQVARDFVDCLEETGVAPLLVSPTHAEAREAIRVIRHHLRDRGHLGDERNFLQYRELKWEEIEKSRAENYEAGQVVQFHQNVPGIKRGSIAPVVRVDESRTVWVEVETGKQVPLDLTKSKHFRVFDADVITLAPGDRIKITNGGKDLNGRRFDNGSLGEVEKITQDGRITLKSGLVLSSKFGHLSYNYDTSHSSQGKTAREEFVLQSSLSFRAGSHEQFYVSISRGKERLRIYTDDRTKLQVAVGNSAKRLSALEFSGFGNELFMDEGISGKSWTEVISRGKAWRRDKLTSQVEKLAEERGVAPADVKYPGFTQQIEARRAKVTADGVKKTLGHPNASKPGRKGRKSISDPRGNEKSSADPLEQPANKLSQEKLEARNQAAEKEKAKAPEVGRVKRAIDSSAKNLKEVVSRTKGGLQAIKEGAKRQINFGNVKTSLGDLANNPKTKQARVESEVAKKPKPAPKPKPPTPVIRRGK